MSDPSFEAKVRSAFRDLDLLRSGWRPGPEIEAVPTVDAPVGSPR